MKEKCKTEFASRLRHLRQIKAKTQTECAKAFSVTAVAYGAWERGDREPCIAKIVQICHYFNTSSDWLLGVNIDTEKEKEDFAKFREEVEKYHILKDKLNELIGDGK